MIRPFVGPAWTAQLHGYPRTPAERPAKRAVDGGRGERRGHRSTGVQEQPMGLATLG